MAADGSVIIQIDADDSKFTGKLKGLAGGAVKGLTTAVTAATTAMTGLAAAAAKVGSEFESTMAATSTMFGDVEVDTAGLNAKILELSNSTGVAATEIGSSLYNALSAGIPVTEDMGSAMDYMESCTQLAKAGFTDVDTAVTATAKILNAYGMDVSEVGDVHKILMQTQNKGITTVNELGASLAQVTPTAAAMSVGFDQVGAALANMTAAGTPTAQATTQLNSLLAELGKSGTQAQKGLEAALEGTEYAGKSFQDLMADGVPLNTVLDLMGDYAEDNGKGMLDMFSSIEGGKAALALAGENSAKFTENLAAMSTEADVVGDAFNKVTDTLENRMDVLKESVKNLGIAVYDGMEAPLKDAAETATDMVGQITQAFAKGGLEGAVGAVGNVLAQLTTKLAGAAPKMINAGVQLLQSLLAGIQQNLPALSTAAAGILTSLVNGIAALLPQLAVTAVQLITALANGIAAALPDLIPAAVGAITALVQGLIDNIPALINAALALIQGLMQGLIAAIPVLVEAIPTIITSLVTALLENLPMIVQAGIDLLVSLVGALPEIIATIVAALPQIIDGIITALLENLPLIVQAGIDLLVALIQALPEIITTIVTALPQIINSIVTALLENLPLIVQAGVDLFVALIQNLPTIIVEIVKAVPQIVAGIVEGFVSLAGTIADIGKNIVSGIWDGIVGMATWIKDKVTGFFGGIVDGVKDFLGIHSPSKVFSDIGTNTVEGYADGVDSGAGKNEKRVLSTVKGLSSDMADTFSNGGADSGQALMSNLTDAAKAALPQVANAAVQTVNTYNTTVISKLGEVQRTTQEVMRTICDTVTAKQPDIVNSAITTVTSFCTTVRGRRNEFYSVGMDAMAGLNEGLIVMGREAIATARSIANAIIAEMQRAMDIHSPSRKMRDLVGKPAGAGFIVGFEDAMADFHRRATAVVDAEAGKITANVSAQADGRAAAQGVTREVHNTTRTVEKIATVKGDGVTDELVRMLGLRIEAEDRRRGPRLDK